MSLKDLRTTSPVKYTVRPAFGYTQYYRSDILADVDAILDTHIPTLIGVQINLQEVFLFRQTSLLTWYNIYNRLPLPSNHYATRGRSCNMGRETTLQHPLNFHAPSVTFWCT